MESYLNLRAEERPLKLIDEPQGAISAMAHANLGHQMRYSAELLERQLAEKGEPRVIQLTTKGDPRNPDYWRLYANGTLVASGTSEYARTCFEREATAFLDLLRKAVERSTESLGADAYAVLDSARRIAQVEIARNSSRG